MHRCTELHACKFVASLPSTIISSSLDDQLKFKGYFLSSAGWRAHLSISGSGQKGVVNTWSADRSMIYRNGAAISLDTVDLRLCSPVTRLSAERRGCFLPGLVLPLETAESFSSIDPRDTCSPSIVRRLIFSRNRNVFYRVR